MGAAVLASLAPMALSITWGGTVGGPEVIDFRLRADTGEIHVLTPPPPFPRRE